MYISNEGERAMRTSWCSVISHETGMILRSGKAVSYDPAKAMNHDPMKAL